MYCTGGPSLVRFQLVRSLESLQVWFIARNFIVKQRQTHWDQKCFEFTGNSANKDSIRQAKERSYP